MESKIEASVMVMMAVVVSDTYLYCVRDHVLMNE